MPPEEEILDKTDKPQITSDVAVEPDSASSNSDDPKSPVVGAEDGTAETLAEEPAMTDPVTNFARLNALNVLANSQRKGGLSFLSLPHAVKQLRLADPGATWEIKRFEGLPYLACEAGMFVEVSVTFQGVTLSQLHPVLDGYNRPTLAPTVLDISTSIQHCLVEAIALHGLGLDVYENERLVTGADSTQRASALRRLISDEREALMQVGG